MSNIRRRNRARAQQRDGLAIALRIAKGCLDYGGGYRSSPVELDAFHHGIRTVIRAMEAKIATPQDSQVRALEIIGRKETT